MFRRVATPARTRAAPPAPLPPSRAAEAPEGCLHRRAAGAGLASGAGGGGGGGGAPPSAGRGALACATPPLLRPHGAPSAPPRRPSRLATRHARHRDWASRRRAPIRGGARCGGGTDVERRWGAANRSGPRDARQRLSEIRRRCSSDITKPPSPRPSKRSRAGRARVEGATEPLPPRATRPRTCGRALTRRWLSSRCARLRAARGAARPRARWRLGARGSTRARSRCAPELSGLWALDDAP